MEDGRVGPGTPNNKLERLGASPSCIHNARRPSPLMMSSPHPPHKTQNIHAYHDTSTNRTHRPPPLATGIRSITVLLNCLLHHHQSISLQTIQQVNEKSNSASINIIIIISRRALLSPYFTLHHHHTTAF